MKRKLFLFAGLGLFALNAFALNLEGTVFEKVGLRFGIDPKLLYAIALTESAYSPKGVNYTVPHPWVIRSETEVIYADSKEKAQEILNSLLAKSDNVDVGMMQINMHWHSDKVKQAQDLLDPETNLSVGAQILVKELESANHDVLRAIGNFHSRDVYRNRLYANTIDGSKICDAITISRITLQR